MKVNIEGQYSLSIFDLQGRLHNRLYGSSPRSFAIGETMQDVLVARIRNSRGCTEELLHVGHARP